MRKTKCPNCHQAALRVRRPFRAESRFVLSPDGRIQPGRVLAYVATDAEWLVECDHCHREWNEDEFLRAVVEEKLR